MSSPSARGNQSIGAKSANNFIADYITALKACGILENVELKYIKETEVDKTTFRKFEIEAAIRQNADARGVEPVPNLRPGTSRDLGKSTASVTPASKAAEPVPSEKGVRSGSEPAPSDTSSDSAGVDGEKE